MGIIICKLPNAGLGNQLFPLMRAHTFGYINKLPVKVVNYHQIKIGPWLRHEKNRRNYDGFFIFEKDIISALCENLKVKWMMRKGVIREPELKSFANPKQKFLFEKIPHYTERFRGLDENRSLVIRLLFGLIDHSILNKINCTEPPCIGIHVRMGDFRKIKEGEKFGKVGTVRTPESYFIEMINEIRGLNGSELPVNVFTDGNKEEFNSLFHLPGVRMMEGNNDLIDLLLLSKSKVIITSAGSTFSYWAAFISDAVVIMHPTYTNIKIRSKKVCNSLYEGAFDSGNPQFIKAIHEIQA